MSRTLPSVRPLKPSAKRWALVVGLVFMVGLSLVLMFLLTQATSNQNLYEQNFAWLVGLNMAVAGLLIGAIGWMSLRLGLRWRKGRFGSRLLAKLAAIFGLVGFLPGLLIYTVSYQFVSRSIESWFDVRVESALTAGVNLGRTTLDTLAISLSNETSVAANALARASNASAALAIERVREQLGATDVVLWSESGKVLASAGDSRYSIAPERPSAGFVRQARTQGTVTAFHGLDVEGDADPTTLANAKLKVLALVNSPLFGIGDEVRYLQVEQPLPAALVADALAVQAANREYQERALARDGLRRMYIGTLTLTLFLAVFGAVLLAVVLGNQLVRPLLVLAEGMREVASGDLSPKPALTSRDELAGLTRTFARMTQDLLEARVAVQHSMSQVDAARDNLQTILDNLTAGVVVMSEDSLVRSVNPGASRILKVPLGLHVGHPLNEVPGLEDFGAGVVQQFERFLAEEAPHEGGYWQESFELAARAGQTMNQETTTLIARGALLPNNERLLVFDDVTELVSAQRSKAWGEVARRLAHEIKNPLTPIQLSAERLAIKLDGKVEAKEQQILTKSVKTIVDQVAAMQRLVNEFRDYARLPTAQLDLVDLNALVKDILNLYEQAEVPVKAELATDLPMVKADPQQVRQVLHNLVQNAQDAQGAVGGAEAGPVVVKSRLSESGQSVRLSVIDNGPGFAENILKRAFEPYVTSKAKGTGLGLPVVKKIMDEHGGQVDIRNRVSDGKVVGAQVSLSFVVANT